jgi:hypothetical protein
LRRALRRSSPDVDRRRTSSSEIRFNSSSRRERNAPTLAPPLSPAKERRLFQSLHQPRPPSILSALASREERGRRLDVENERGISPKRRRSFFFSNAFAPRRRARLESAPGPGAAAEAGHARLLWPLGFGPAGEPGGARGEPDGGRGGEFLFRFSFKKKNSSDVFFATDLLLNLFSLSFLSPRCHPPKNQVALATGFALGALFASLLAVSKLGRRRRAETEAKAKTTRGRGASSPCPAAAGAATATVSLLSPSAPAAAADAALEKQQRQQPAPLSSDAALLDARLLREAVRARELAEAEAELARREAAALREEVAALGSRLAASQKTRRAVAAELAAAFGLPPTPTPASAPPRSGLGGGGGGAGGGATAASRFFASPPPAKGSSSEGRASRVAQALAAA